MIPEAGQDAGSWNFCQDVCRMTFLRHVLMASSGRDYLEDQLPKLNLDACFSDRKLSATTQRILSVPSAEQPVHVSENV